MKQVNGQLSFFDDVFVTNIQENRLQTNSKKNIKIDVVGGIDFVKKEKEKELDRINGVVTIKYLHELFEKAQELLKEIGIPYSENVQKILTINKRATARYGRCKKIGNSYQIEVTEILLKGTDDGVITTLIHELLHTCPGCMNHGVKWKNYANIVTQKTKYNIQRTTSHEEKGLEKRVVERNYIVRCEKCKQEVKRAKVSKLIKYPQYYRCGICGGSFVRVQ